MSLAIAKDFSLPIDVAGEAIGILATRGAGKSFTSAVLVEELFEAGIQVVVLDPTGVYWGLRGSGQKKGGLPIYVFGGEHGDLPLEASSGELFAEVAVEESHSFVLDLSSFDTKSQQTRFVRAFAERLYRRKSSNREPLHLIIDEADEFAPQRPLGKDEPAMLGAMEAIVRRGRSRGLGCTLISQRSAALNKNVLALAETLILMRTPGPQDRKAVEAWISHHYLADELGVLDSLPSLRTGSAWIWSPVRDVLKQVDIRRIRTFDSYRTPKPGEVVPTPNNIAPIDLTDLGNRMTATVERAKASDPRELHKQIRELEAQLRQRPVEEKVQEVIVEIPILTDSEIGDLETVVHEMRNSLAAATESIDNVANRLLSALAERRRTDHRTQRMTARGMPPAPTPEPAADASVNGFRPTSSQKKVLDAIAWLEGMGLEADRLRVGFIAGYRQSGNFNNLLSALNTAGAIRYPRPGAVALTSAGSALAEHPEMALTTSEIQDRVMSKLTPAQQRVLTVILDCYPEDLSREELAKRTGYTQSGNFNNLVSRLSGLGLIDRSRPGYVRAEDLLFVQ